MIRWVCGLILYVACSAGLLADPVWVDVRSPEEYKSSHIEGDRNLPYKDIATTIGSVVADRDADIRVYCAKGGRAEVARKTLEDLGYQHVSNAGGIDDVRRARGLTE